MSGWSVIQEADEMDMGRYFEYDSQTLDALRIWLPFIVKHGAEVLEVGAGSGYFTGKILALNPEAKLTCLEPDELLRSSIVDKFAERVRTTAGTIEANQLADSSYDAVVCHIVLHNIYDVARALRQMKRYARRDGWIAAIEPLRGGYVRYPTDEIQRAFEFVHQATLSGWQVRRKILSIPDGFNPWGRHYVQLFEEAGLHNIRCNGLASVFTLSDPRLDMKERVRWSKMRLRVYERLRPKWTRQLVETGKSREDVDVAYETVLRYLTGLVDATEEGLSHVHEQEVTLRTITVGQKP